MKHKKLVFMGILGLIIAAVLIYANRGTHGPISRVDLDRPLIVGVVSWPGYAGGIVANGGFKENPKSIYTEKYGLPVRFVLIEDIDARGKAFAKGGPDGVDVVWSTIDFWANELPNFIAGGINGKAFLHVDWSRGGDAIVSDANIKRVENLKDKKVALVQFTPSHWLLETALRNSRLNEVEQQKIRDSLVFTQDVQTARAAFTAGQVNAAVLWEPDVKQALKKEGTHVLVSTQDFPNIIADVMVAKQEFIDIHPRAMEAFVRGWLDGVEETKRDLNLAARVLVENEPLFEDLGMEATRESLSWVYWPNLNDNARMFGLDGEPPLFDSIFKNASEVWQSLGVIQSLIEATQAKDDSILRKIYTQ